MSNKINGKDLKETFGLVILSGAEKLLNYPERKEPLAFDWKDEHGQEYDLKKVFLKDKQVSLKCAFLADNHAEFWKNYDAFFNEIAKAGFQTLYINDHEKQYEFFYKSSSSFNIVLKRLKNVLKVFVKFDLNLLIKTK